MPTPNQPHILLITTDQLRKDVLGCYGGAAVRTPHIDAIAAREGGTRFDRAYTASPLCLPARCSMLTGLFPHNSRAYSNFRLCPLDPKLPNLYNQLQRAGYTTAHFGKCHYTPAPYDDARPEATIDRENVEDYTLNLGLNHLDLLNGKSNSVWFWNDYSRELDAAGYLAAYREQMWKKQENRRIFPFPAPDHWHPDAWISRKAVEYINTHNHNTPQFLWVSLCGPHFPFDAPESYYSRVDMQKLPPLIYKDGEFDQSKIQSAAFHGGDSRFPVVEGRIWAPDRACKNYSDDFWNQLRQAYLANVALIDDGVGSIIASARAVLGENLLIFFTTDHGEMLGNHRLWGKNGCAYEDVLNVPLLAQFPGQSKNIPQHSNALVRLTDLLPTCLTVAGAPIPQLTDGRDLRQSLTDGGHPYILAESEGLLTISDGRYKYTQCRRPPDLELCEAYDLLTDPHEFNNVINTPSLAPQISQLRSTLLSAFMNDLLN
ncbi:MAG: sulfatase-like hydrolase/transferase [Phycisphaerales bacterium]|nr:sulfatase-like hydrolase/transferase [Phycisphaerales bacterium]